SGEVLGHPAGQRPAGRAHRHPARLPQDQHGAGAVGRPVDPPDRRVGRARALGVEQLQPGVGPDEHRLAGGGVRGGSRRRGGTRDPGGQGHRAGGHGTCGAEEQAAAPDRGRAGRCGGARGAGGHRLSCLLVWCAGRTGWWGRRCARRGDHGTGRRAMDSIPFERWTVAIRIRMDARALARSTFGTSPAVEVVGVVRSRGRHPMPHVRDWYAAALARVPERHLEVLHALVPAAGEHPHVPDFLCPPPAGVAEPVGAVVERIAATPPEVVDYQLDISVDGRPVRPEVAGQWGSEAAYRGWRRTPPPALLQLVGDGPRVVAERAAEAVAAVFEEVLAGPWPEVMAVLEADIAHRGT